MLDALDERPGEPLPHVYSNRTLCLHKAGEWTPGMFIADSTLAWTAEWLFNFEEWRTTGDWYGGEEWPPRGRSTDVKVHDDRQPPPRADAERR